jgi:hypothetical protein
MEDVGVNYLEAGFAVEFPMQDLDHRGVEFDGDDAAGALQQLLGERALAGADFDDEIVTLWANRARNAIEYGAVGEKMLPEFLRHVGR